MKALVYKDPRGIGPQGFNPTKPQERTQVTVSGLWWEIHLLTVFIVPSTFSTFF